jgi:hypothetical protein
VLQCKQGYLRRRHVRAAGQRAGEGLVAEVVAGAVGVRPFLPPAGDRADHQPRIATPQVGGRQAEARQGAGAEALHQHVGRQQQVLEALAGRRTLEVEGEALVAGQQHRRQRAAALLALRVVAHRIAEPRLLHLDHPRPHVRQQPGHQRPRQIAAQVDDADAVERTRLGAGGGHHVLPDTSHLTVFEEASELGA